MDEIVISGISCRLPESDNMDEFWDNLVSGKDMVTETNRRWPPGLYILVFVFIVFSFPGIRELKYNLNNA